MKTVTKQQNQHVREHILVTGQRIMAGKGFSGLVLTEELEGSYIRQGMFFLYFSPQDTITVTTS